MMGQQRSPGTGRRYPLTLVCRVWRVGRSSVSAAPAAAGAAVATAAGKRGPHTALSDAALVARIRELLAPAPFHGAG